MSYIISILIAALGIAIVLAIRLYAQVKARAAREYQDATNEFFDAARPLISDDDTPSEIIDMIAGLSATIQNRSMASRLASFPLHVKYSDRSLRTFKVAEEFFSSRPELEESFYKMFYSWFAAVTALSPLAGFAARYSLTNKDSMQAAAAKTSKKVSNRHPNDGGQPLNGPMVHAH